MGKSESGDRHKKRWYQAIILVVWLLIVSLARDVWHIRTGFRRVEGAELRLEAEKAKSEALKTRLELVMTEDYKEKVIREKLNMQKEGEVLVVLPEKAAVQEAAGVVVFVPSWKKWWNLISR